MLRWKKTITDIMSHNHSHHHHEVKSYNKAFAVGVVLNTLFVIIEVTYGFFANSLALIADAGHNLSDVTSLLLAWGASILASKKATRNRTYGFRKTTIFASLISSILLLGTVAIIIWEAIERFQNPHPVQGTTIIIVAAIGIVINTATALLFVRGQKHDLNLRGAFLHMAADAAVSLGVVIAGAVFIYTGWHWIDPVISLLIVAVIFISSWGLFKDSVIYALDFVPKSIDSKGIEKYLLGLEKVLSVHDLHIWALSTTETALTAHLIINDEKLDNELLFAIQKHLHDHFDIEHSTIQMESLSASSLCQLKDVC